ncbi:MAG TPA: chemotaxis protein CheW [Spirochaetota bacterium]|nr:chemotaxis protein CheW [Spirochaetota bacterium]
MSFSLGEYQDIFLEEADELLQELNHNLLELEKNPENEEIINNIFRAAHSLKSSAAFVGLNDLSDLAHRMENLLQGIRDKTNDITPEVVEVIFKCFDMISEVIEMVASGVEPNQNLRPLIDRINTVNENSRMDKTGSAAVRPGAAKDSAAKNESNTLKTTFTAKEAEQIKKALSEGMECFEITVRVEDTAQMKWVKSQLIITSLERDGSIIKSMPSVDEMSYDDSINVFRIVLITYMNITHIYKGCNVDQVENIELKRITVVEKDGKQILKIGTPIRSEQVSAPEKKQTFEPKSFGTASSAVTPTPVPDNVYTGDEDSSSDELDIPLFDVTKTDIQAEQEKRKAPVLKTVKVSVDKLDLLLNNVGELVIANSGFYRLYEEIRKYAGNKAIISEFKNRMEQMSRIAKDLQTGIMKTRMVPIGQVFTRFNRLVRDLAREHKKNVQLIIKGEETELDKKVIDVIGEPLLHLIRNAVDHGIESPEERMRLGKTETAIITLNAYQGGNQIFVEISDDGRGLDIKAIRDKVIEKKISTAEILANMDDMDIYNYIFIPGFSTAKTITDISGRGVGMNVVKETVNELNGNVNIETEKGMGTRFVLSFPLTLAIIPAIMVKVRKEVYAIPLSDVIETIKISQSDIATIEGHEVINLRGEILSLLRLNEFVGLKSVLKSSQKIPVVVVGFGSRKIGLIVDYLEGKMEIVIKSLEQNYKTVEGLAGASILGDGSICLILDIQAMINRVIYQQEKLSLEEREKLMRSRMVQVDDEDGTAVEEPVEDVYETVQPEAVKPDDAKDEKPNYISDVFIFDDTSTETSASPAVQTREPVMRALATEMKIEAPAAVINKPATEKVNEKIKAADGPAMTAVTEVPSSEIDGRVHDALQEFRSELKKNIQDVVGGGSHDSHIASELNISKAEIDEFNLISNMGAANAAESLSKILGKRIDLSIPEVKLTPIEKIPQFLGNLDEPYMGVMLGIEGEINGTLLLILQEETGYELIDMLYGTQAKAEKKLSEDGISAIKELTNIIGSSILNVYAEKSKLIVKPNVPTFVHDYLQSVMDSVLVLHNMKDDYAIVMETAFYFEDDKVMGNLLILPETDSLKTLVKGVRSNVSAD